MTAKAAKVFAAGNGDVRAVLTGAACSAAFCTKASGGLVRTCAGAVALRPLALHGLLMTCCSCGWVGMLGR